jgi:hypothetical protein
MSPEIETEEPEYRADVGKGGWMVVCLALSPSSHRSAVLTTSTAAITVEVARQCLPTTERQQDRWSLQYCQLPPA